MTRRQLLTALGAGALALPLPAFGQATGTPVYRALQQASTTIPIVITVSSDPVGEGFAASLARPGGNITGLSARNDDVSVKHLELLKTAVPKLSRIAVLLNPANGVHASTFKMIQAVPQKVGLRVLRVDGGTPDEIERGFAVMARERADALMIFADTFFGSRRNTSPGWRLRSYRSRSAERGIVIGRAFIFAVNGLSLIKQRLQARDYIDRNRLRRALFEHAPARPHVDGASVIACDDTLGIGSAAHQRDRKARMPCHSAALCDRTDQRKPALIERLWRNHKYKSCAALFRTLGGVEIHVPDLPSIGHAHQMISVPTGLDDCQARSSRDGLFVKSHLARSSARVYRGFEIGVIVTLPRSTPILTREPARRLSCWSEGLGRATTTEPPTARSTTLGMI